MFTFFSRSTRDEANDERVYIQKLVNFHNIRNKDGFNKQVVTNGDGRSPLSLWSVIASLKRVSDFLNNYPVDPRRVRTSFHFFFLSLPLPSSPSLSLPFPLSRGYVNLTSNFLTLFFLFLPSNLAVVSRPRSPDLVEKFSSFPFRLVTRVRKCERKRFPETDEKWTPSDFRVSKRGEKKNKGRRV